MNLPRRDLSDPRALRALAHPTRQRILRRLAEDGPATSAMLARELDEDRGATSFHLRQLGTYGFIAVDEERSAGRRKFWRLISQDLRLPRVPGAEGAAEAGAVMSQMWGDSLAALARFYREGDPWVEAAELSHGALRLTREELREFGDEYLALLGRFVGPAEDAPDDARPVIALFAAFPSR